MRGAIAALALIALAAIAAPPARAQVDPYAIYDRARTFWMEQAYPPYLSYDVSVTVEEKSRERVERYRSGFNAVDDSLWVDPVSDYEIAHPHVVHGINVFIQTRAIGKPEQPIDFFGVPILAPAYSFGMAPFVASKPPSSAQDAAALVAAVRRAFHDPYPTGRTPAPSPAASALPLIAHLVESHQIYRIALLGEESVNGHECYHLTLQPLKDPGRYRLRQLWIDEQTSATWRLQEALNFVSGPGTTVPWTVNFTSLGGAQYISDESADATVRYDGLQYTHVTVAFENLEPVAVPQGDPLYIAPSHDTLVEP